MADEFSNYEMEANLIERPPFFFPDDDFNQTLIHHVRKNGMVLVEFGSMLASVLSMNIQIVDILYSELVRSVKSLYRIGRINPPRHATWP